MADLVLPHIKMTKTQGHYSCYEIGPIFAGFSASLASGLRRVLLSSLPGAALTSLLIEGVLHEFQDIPNVKEDVTEIVQNLKKVRFRSYTSHPVSVYLNALGECRVTAACVKAPGTIEIVNPDAHIAMLDNEQAHLSMEMTVSTGRGFVEAGAQARACEPQPIGVILLDAIYSPIIHVNFTIEHAHMGDLDTIILEVTTDGTISPDDALRQSADILRKQFFVFASREYEKDEVKKTAHSSDILVPRSLYHLAIEELGLSFRSVNALRRSGITKVGHILVLEEHELLLIRNFGEKSFQELVECLLFKGFLPPIDA